MEDDPVERRVLARFEKSQEFLGYLQTIVDVDIFADAAPTQALNDAHRHIHYIV